MSEPEFVRPVVAGAVGVIRPARPHGDDSQVCPGLLAAVSAVGRCADVRAFVADGERLPASRRLPASKRLRASIGDGRGPAGLSGR